MDSFVLFVGIIIGVAYTLLGIFVGIAADSNDSAVSRWTRGSVSGTVLVLLVWPLLVPVITWRASRSS